MKLSPRVGVGQGAVMDWARILAYVTGTVDQELLARNEYLAAENRISCSTSRLIRGLPGPRRAFEPSNLQATSLRYQPRMVSGRAL